MGLIKVAYVAIREGNRSISNVRALVWASISRNLSVNVNSGLRPSMIMLGGSDLLESLATRTMQPLGVELNSNMQEQIVAVARARDKVMEADSKNIIRLSLTRPLRAHSSESFKAQDTIRVPQRLGSEKTARRHSGYRVLSSTGRHIVDERGNRLVKIPAHQARKAESLLDQEMKAVTPNDTVIIPNAVPGSGAKARSEIAPVTGGGSAANSNLDVAGSPDDVLAVGVQRVCDESMRKQQRIAIGGYEDAVGELEMSQWAAHVPFIYHSTWECWSTGHVEEERLVGKALASEEMALEGHDLNRITPKGFLKIDAARQAIIRGIVCLTRVESNGEPAMSIVNGLDPKYRALTKVHSNVVMRKKTPLLYKARIVSRGDMVSEAEVAFSSAPTTSRISPRIVVCVAQAFALLVGRLGVTQAFLQADTVAFGDRQIVIIPGYVVLPGPETLKTKDGKYRSTTEEDFRVMTWGEWQQQGRRARFNPEFITNKPLYSGRGAPLRWFVRISELLRRGGRRQMRSECCSFSRYTRNADQSVARISSFLIIYVDDILIAADSNDWKLFKQVMSEMEAGEVNYLNRWSAIDFFGGQFTRSGTDEIGIHMSKFASAMQEIPLADVYQKERFVLTEERANALCRQSVGSLLFAAQAHFEVSRDVALLSTSIADACRDVKKAKEFFIRYNRVVRTLKTTDRTMRYHDILGENRGAPRI